MKSLGGNPHPILDLYSQLGFFDRWRCGSLLGALFFALPLALAGGVVESVSRIAQSKKAQWTIRFVLVCPWIAFQGGLIHHFAISPWLYVYGWSILLFLPLALGEVLESLLIHWKERFPSRTWRKAILIPALILFPILIHPVWSLFISLELPPNLDEKYGKGTSSSVRLTMARDWFLLDENGQNWLNSLYYSSAPILMERDRVTVFQPMVVALVGKELQAWKSWFGVHFAMRNNQMGQPIFFIQTQSPTDLDSPLFRDQLDYVILDASFKDKNLTASWPQGSYCFFHRGISNEADGILLHDKNTFRANKERFPDGYFFHTPLIERRDQIRREGLNPNQTRLASHYKSLLFDILSQPHWIAALGCFGGLGLLVFLAWAVSPFASSRPILLFLCAAGALLIQCGMWKDSLNYRVLRSDGDFWDQHRELKLMSLTLSQTDVSQILSQTKADDSRLLILQWLIMGRAYPNMPKEIKEGIVHKLSTEIERYNQLPFNLRYKLIDACARVPPLWESMRASVLKEEHPYVRWYARDKGLDGI